MVNKVTEQDGKAGKGRYRERGGGADSKFDRNGSISRSISSVTFHGITQTVQINCCA